MSHQSEKLYYGSSAEERDFSLPYPAFLLEPGFSLPLGTARSSLFISPALTWGWGAHGKLGCCFVLRLSSVSAVWESWFRDQVNTFFCMQKPGRQKHTSAVSVVKYTSGFPGDGNSEEGPVHLPRALLPSNGSIWWPQQEGMTGWYSLQPPLRSV